MCHRCALVLSLPGFVCLFVCYVSFFRISLRDLCTRLLARLTLDTKFVYFENGYSLRTELIAGSRPQTTRFSWHHACTAVQKKVAKVLARPGKYPDRQPHRAFFQILASRSQLMMRFLSCDVRSGSFFLFGIMLGTLHRYKSTSNFCLGRNGDFFTKVSRFACVRLDKIL